MMSYTQVLVLVELKPITDSYFNRFLKLTLNLSTVTTVKPKLELVPNRQHETLINEYNARTEL